MEHMKVVILCGGKGTRSYPFTEYFPKVMMPINGTPILVHLMRTYASQGFNEFVLAGGHRIEMLHDYFDGRFADWNVKIVNTGDDADTGDRIFRCSNYVGERFFATYGDGLGDLDLHALLAAHKRSGGLATLTTVPLRSQYGLVVFDENDKVQRFEEKPLVARLLDQRRLLRVREARARGVARPQPRAGGAAGFRTARRALRQPPPRLLEVDGHEQGPADLEALCVGGDVPWGSRQAVAPNA